MIRMSNLIALGMFNSEIIFFKLCIKNKYSDNYTKKVLEVSNNHQDTDKIKNKLDTRTDLGGPVMTST